MWKFDPVPYSIQAWKILFLIAALLSGVLYLLINRVFITSRRLINYFFLTKSPSSYKLFLPSYWPRKYQDPKDLFTKTLLLSQEGRRVFIITITSQNVMLKGFPGAKIYRINIEKRYNIEYRKIHDQRFVPFRCFWIFLMRILYGNFWNNLMFYLCLYRDTGYIKITIFLHVASIITI